MTETQRAIAIMSLVWATIGGYFLGLTTASTSKEAFIPMESIQIFLVLGTALFLAGTLILVLTLESIRKSMVKKENAKTD